MSSPIKVSMKCREKFYTFEKKTYPSVLAEYNITKKEWEQIALEATRVIGTAWINKKHSEKITIPPWMNFSSLITLGILLIYFVTLYIYGSSDERINYLLTFSLVCIVFALVTSIGLAIYNFVRELSTFYPFKDYIVKEFKGYLTELNQRYQNKASFAFNVDTMELECTLLSKD